MGLAAHRDTFFRPLEGVGTRSDPPRDARPDIDLSGGGRRRRTASQVDVLGPTAASSLTLVTCYPFGYLGSAPYRFVVRSIQLADTYGAD